MEAELSAHGLGSEVPRAVEAALEVPGRHQTPGVDQTGCVPVEIGQVAREKKRLSAEGVQALQQPAARHQEVQELALESRFVRSQQTNAPRRLQVQPTVRDLRAKNRMFKSCLLFCQLLSRAARVGWIMLNSIRGIQQWDTIHTTKTAIAGASTTDSVTVDLLIMRGRSKTLV